jgi:lipopolysaccharide export system permease protein
MILFRYILREHVAPFLFSFFIITFLFVMDYLLSIIDSIFSKGLNPSDVMRMFVLNMAWMVALSVPMAVLVASLMAYGRLSSDNEITVLKAAGVTAQRILFPSLVMSLVIALGLIYFNNAILPESNHRAAMLYLDIAQKRPAAILREGQIMDDFKGYKLIVGRVNQLTGEMREIKIYQEEKGRVTLTFAHRGELAYINRGRVIQLSLYEGESHREDVEHPGDYFRSEFTKQLVYIDNVDDTLRRTTDQQRGDREMSSAMMLEKVRGFKADRVRENGTILQAVKEDSVTRLASKALGAKTPASFDFARLSPLEYGQRLSLERNKARLLLRKRYTLDNSKQLISKYMVEVHKKFSIPAACPVFVLVGAPLGVLARTGGVGVGVSFSLGFFILYWVFLIGGEWLADSLLVPPWAAMWSPNLLLLGVGAWLFLRMLREKEFTLRPAIARRARIYWRKLRSRLFRQARRS